MEPSLPYPEKGGGFTSGHQGTDTSRRRALSDDRSGATQQRQQKVMDVLYDAGPSGMTALELRDYLGEDNPNKVSPACTVLHKDGRIERLQEVRGNHHVYVHPAYVEGRSLYPFKDPDPRRYAKLLALLNAHTPACSGPYAVPKADGTRCGPVFCVQCSAAVQEWVTWTPEHVVENA